MPRQRQLHGSHAIDRNLSGFIPLDVKYRAYPVRNQPSHFWRIFRRLRFMSRRLPRRIEAFMSGRAAEPSRARLRETLRSVFRSRSIACPEYPWIFRAHRYAKFLPSGSLRAELEARGFFGMHAQRSLQMTSHLDCALRRGFRHLFLSAKIGSNGVSAVPIPALLPHVLSGHGTTNDKGI